jgi:hypothetical protein
LAEKLDDAVLQPSLIALICNAPLDVKYADYLLEFDVFLQQLSRQRRAAVSSAANKSDAGATNMRAQVQLAATRLLHTCVARLRSFLIERIGALARVKTNVQIVQSALVKHASFLHFLQRHASSSQSTSSSSSSSFGAPLPYIFEELRDYYVDVTRAVYHYHFHTYRTDLAKLQTLANTARAADRLGAPQRRTSSGASTLDKRRIDEVDTRRSMYALAAPLLMRDSSPLADAASYLRSWYRPAATDTSTTTTTATAAAASSSSNGSSSQSSSSSSITRATLLDCLSPSSKTTTILGKILFSYSSCN